MKTEGSISEKHFKLATEGLKGVGKREMKGFQPVLKKKEFIFRKEKMHNPCCGNKVVTSEMALQQNLAALRRKRRVAQPKEIVPVFREDFRFAVNYPFGPVDFYYSYMAKVQPWSIKEFGGWYLCEYQDGFYLSYR